MTLKSRRIRERHIAVDILCTTLGGFLFDGLAHHNWTSLIIAAVLLLPLVVLDRQGIENEEKDE